VARGQGTNLYDTTYRNTAGIGGGFSAEDPSGHLRLGYFGFAAQRTDVAGAFTAGFADPVSTGPVKFSGAQILDLNGDGLVDLIWPGQTVHYALQVPGQPGQYGASVGLGATNPHAFAAGRIDGDSLSDVLIAGNNNQIFLQNPSDHSFGAAGTLMAPLTDQLALVDINGDGRNDVISGTAAVLACKAPAPAGTFSSGGISASIPLQGANPIWYFDLNGDGRMDALGPNSSSGQLMVVLQQ
jgi:hypothetical protein